MTFKVSLVIEIKSYKACQAEWDNNSHSIFMLGKSSSFSGFKALDVDINGPVRLFSKSIQQWTKWPSFILKIALMSIT